MAGRTAGDASDEDEKEGQQRLKTLTPKSLTGDSGHPRNITAPSVQR